VNRRKIGLVVLAVFAAGLIGLLLRDVVEQVIIRPLIYLFWLLGLLYRTIPQPVWWLVLLLGMLLFALRNFAGKWDLPELKLQKLRAAPGPVQELAGQIERKNWGVYFKWQIARSLAEIAMDLQELRQHSRRKLDFEGSAASPAVRAYLEAALNTSFSDYPMQGGLLGRFASAPPTPFDGDIGPVIEYLETIMEQEDDLKRP
jgi:hypothetical protein